MKRSASATFAIAVAGLSMTVFTLGWVQKWLTSRFIVPMVVVAVGVPALVTLCRRKPLRSRETAKELKERQRQQARAARAAQGKNRPKKGEQKAPAAPPPLFTRPAWLRQAALVGAAVCVWALIAALLSPHPGLAMVGEFDNGNGAILTLSLVAAWALGVTVGAESAELIEWALLASVGLNVLVALYQAVLNENLFGGRAQGLGVNPVFFGGFLIGGLWLVIRRFPTDWRIWGPALALVVAGIQLSGSRLAILLVPVALIAAIRAISLRKAAFATVFVVVGLALGAGISTISSSTASTTPAATATSATATPASVNATAPLATGTSRLTADSSGFRPRLEAWGMAAHAIAQRPIQGWGPGRFLEATHRYRTLRFVTSEGPQKYFEDAHNFVVEYTTTTGIVGIVLMLGFVALALRQSGWQAPLAGFAILSLATHLGEPQNPQLTPLCFLALGAAAAGRASILVPVASWIKASAVSVAVFAGLLISLGSIDLQSRPGPAKELTNLRTARPLLVLWPEPLTGTSNYISALQARQPGALARAEHWALLAAEREPYRSNLWNDAGVKATTAQDLATAGKYFQRATVEDRWSPAALTNYARWLVAQHRNAEGVDYFGRSLRVDPNQPAIRAEMQKAQQAQ